MYVLFPFQCLHTMILLLLEFYFKYVQIVKQKMQRTRPDTIHQVFDRTERMTYGKRLLLVACFLSLVIFVWVLDTFFISRVLLFSCFGCRHSYRLTLVKWIIENNAKCAFFHVKRVCIDFLMIEQNMRQRNRHIRRKGLTVNN